MKQILLLAMIAFFAPTFENEITEEIFLNEDGSGKYNVYFNQVPIFIQQKMKTEGLSEAAAKEAVWQDHSPKFHYSNSVYQDAPKAFRNDPELKKLLRHSVYFTIGNKHVNSINTGVMCKFDTLEELAALMELYRANPLRTFETKPTFKNKIQVSKKGKALSLQLDESKALINTSIYLPNKIKKLKGKAKKEGQVVRINSAKASSLKVSWE